MHFISDPIIGWDPKDTTCTCILQVWPKIYFFWQGAQHNVNLMPKYVQSYQCEMMYVLMAICCHFILQMTVRKTLSDFRRTHHDNWHEHKQQFTDDQLVVLTDLLVSPCYYAWSKRIPWVLKCRKNSNCLFITVQIVTVKCGFHTLC